MIGKSTQRKAKPGRMAALARLPLFFALQGKRAVIAGGSAAAAWKAELLSAAGAEVAVYAADLSAAMKTLAADPPQGRVSVNRRAWTAADLTGAAVAIGDFADEAGAAAFCQAARARSVPVNVIDRPAFCDFSFGAIVNRSPLVVGISTDGAAPVFAQAIRGKVEALLPAGFSGWAAAAARWRESVKQSGLSRAARRTFWELFVARALARPDSPPRPDDFEWLLTDAAAAGVTERGSVAFVSVDPDNPDLLTLRAIRALQAADTILYDDRVPAEALDFARREARKIGIGDARYDRLRNWPDVEALGATLAKQGERVVVVIAKRIHARLSSAA
jgi:uroporphyrin-III C-methyltransferase/precorrin-2 dehydrogenase/sirohydrochlorin ferrochelatase